MQNSKNTLAKTDYELVIHNVNHMQKNLNI